MKKYKTQTLMTEINITPFTDVILVLLIIFMIATPLISQSHIDIRLPKASSKEKNEDPQQHFVSITGEGVVYFDNVLLTNKELKQKINELLSTDPSLKVVIAADKSCRFQEIVRVIDILKAEGVKSLNIATKTED